MKILRRIENATRTSNDKAPSPYKSWLEYWEDHTHIQNAFCSNHICLNKATLGGHIKFVGDDTLYIVPLCDSCNQLESSYWKRSDAVLVNVPSD